MKLTFRQTFVLLAVATALLALATVRTHAADYDDLVARGDYLVNQVGLCADCHSPRNEKGEFVLEHWLKGAALPFQPTVPMPWSPVAPPIAGLPSMTEDEAVRFFTTGARADGSRPRPPMPAFRFKESDAQAVVAYLKSLAK
jgi:mono/diheme cytochrome c family protein